MAEEDNRGASWNRSPVRRPTRVVHIGNLEIGGPNPIRVQSMTTTDTRDVEATTDQIERLVGAGCEVVRVTVPSQKDIPALAEIRTELSRRRVEVPLVADIHFTPGVAMAALELVEKVRINPGNFADRKRFATREYSDAEYRAEFERVADRFRPVVRRARELGRALRIGTNHGSLSDRIMNRHGDSPGGMVESALEFYDVCEAEGLRDVIFSMKSSNPIVTIAAYRLLAQRLDRRSAGQPEAPLHLGVTEAGAGRDARIKSALGIGTLLEEGIGDTIRVSLTEDPLREIPVARSLADRFDARFRATVASERPHGVQKRQPGSFYWAKNVREEEDLGSTSRPTRRPVRIDVELGRISAKHVVDAKALSETFRGRGDRSAEGLVVDVREGADVDLAKSFQDAIESKGLEIPMRVRAPLALASRVIEMGLSVIAIVTSESPQQEILALATAADAIPDAMEWALVPTRSGSDPSEVLECLVNFARETDRRVLSVSAEGDSFIDTHRQIATRIAESGCEVQIALRHRTPESLSPDTALLHASTDLGALLSEGIGDAVSLRLGRSITDTLDLSYRILQAARVRITQAEFISCPSCGRTQFELESVTERIRRRTEHLRDVKIAIMGCIVNGPGEMADADFGYVGSGPGKVHLYVGRDRVVAHVAEAEAADRLEELIRTHGRWADPPPPC
jgi:(E)-4-hydroxy-3-methylbut-2-enyl-diphosphate synthase